MAARTPRRSFASPFVVTLAAVPACYVQSTPGPQSAPPPHVPPSQTAHPQPQSPAPQPPPPAQPPPAHQAPAQPPPVVVANPPPPTTQPPPSEQRTEWTVYKTKDGACMAAIKVECHPKATCNPPPPFPYACPENVSLDKPVTVVMRDGERCFVEYEMPKCPPGVACNPPRPQPVACPKR